MLGDGAPGFAAVVTATAADRPSLADAVAVIDGEVPVAVTGRLQLASWGGPAPEPDRALLLTREVRRRDGALQSAEVAHALAVEDDAVLAQMLPTFGAAVRIGPESVRACTDALGFRQLYLTHGDGWAAVSTSARVLAALGGGGFDREALAVQSQLGWQLGRRTIFAGVSQLAAGHSVTLGSDGASLRCFLPPVDPGRLTLAQAVAQARDLLRGYLAAYLDDHPDAVLQLTGGQDSRLLLSAIEPHRRRGLRVMTLGVPGNPDVGIAAALARRYSMDHEIIDLAGLDELDPEHAHERAVRSAERLEASADPLAYAGLDFAEARSLPGPRISGLGGEVARGFYYLGRGVTAPVTAVRASRLADWRMFANEAVEPDALDRDFGPWAREVAHTAVLRSLTASGESWFAATDALYLDHRMQRWAGATETPVAGHRRIVNPMLDDRFITIARSLAPEDKRGSRFLARLQVALDTELAAIPLDGRPAPAAYASSRVVSTVSQSRATAYKALRKAGQRLGGQRRPPAGGAVLADLVTLRWRRDPSMLEDLRGTGIFDAAWLDQVATGLRQPTPATTAFLVNVAVAHRAQTVTTSAHRVL